MSSTVRRLKYVRGSVLRNRRGRWCGFEQRWYLVQGPTWEIGLTWTRGIGYRMTRVLWLDGRQPFTVPFPDRRIPRMKRIKLHEPVDDKVTHLAEIENNSWAEGLHPLVKFLCLTKYDDGSPRTPGEMRLKTRGRSWECQLIDHDGRAHCRMVSSSLDDVLAMACLGLETEELPWESAEWLPKPKGKK